MGALRLATRLYKPIFLFAGQPVDSMEQVSEGSPAAQEEAVVDESSPSTAEDVPVSKETPVVADEAPVREETEETPRDEQARSSDDSDKEPHRVGVPSSAAFCKLGTDLPLFSRRRSAVSIFRPCNKNTILARANYICVTLPCVSRVFNCI